MTFLIEKESITIFMILSCNDYVSLIIFFIRTIIEDKKPKNKVRFYVARDRSDSTLYIYLSKPCRDISKFYPSANGSIIAIQDYFYKFGLNEKDFDNLKFEDGPVEVFLNLED